MVHFKEFICVIFNYLSIKVVVKLYFAINFAPLSLFFRVLKNNKICRFPSAYLFLKMKKGKIE